MIAALFPLLRPFLDVLDPEAVHDATLRALQVLPPRRPSADDPRLAVDALGRRFPNPVGLAAGLDKGAVAPDALLGFGFGFIEVGGVVPRPQGGNPRPRVFRLPRDKAIVNRYGLNSEGLDPVRDRLRRRSGRPGIVGINIGANKDSADRLKDYVVCVDALGGLADFLTVNVSSPNTPGLRDLQGEGFLDDLLARVVGARDAVGTDAAGRRAAILIKIAPDLGLHALDTVVATALRRGVDGLVVANTTTARPDTLQNTAAARQAGGLSGRPLFAPSTRLLAEAFLRVEGRLILVGVGGVESGETAWAKIRAGASLVQLYTALVYKGPKLIPEIKRSLLGRLAADGLDSLSAIVGRDAGLIAAGRIY